LFGTFSGLTLAKLVLTVIAPIAPIMQWTQKNVIANSQSIKTLEELNCLINATWEEVKNGGTISENRIRQIQDGTFINRKGSPLIPDFVYDRLRPNLEKKTHYTVKALVQEYSSRQT
jgi:hypothetical protein